MSLAHGNSDELIGATNMLGRDPSFSDRQANVLESILNHSDLAQILTECLRLIHDFCTGKVCALYIKQNSASSLNLLSASPECREIVYSLQSVPLNHPSHPAAVALRENRRVAVPNVASVAVGLDSRSSGDSGCSSRADSGSVCSSSADFSSNWAESLLSHNLRAAYAFPIHDSAREGDASHVGALVLFDSEPYRLGAEEEDIIARVARTLAFAIQRDKVDREHDYLRYHDALTGAANQRWLNVTVSEQIKQSSPGQTSAEFALCHFDIDDFQNINQEIGHLVADTLLQVLVQRVQQAWHGIGDIVRVGGDSFVGLLRNVSHHDTVDCALKLLYETLDSPIQVHDRLVDITISTGIALYPTDGHTLDELMSAAETAMLHVKRQGKGHHKYYVPFMKRGRKREVQMQRDIKSGLLRGEFFLEYQPRVDIDGYGVTSCEALVRWLHPKYGIIGPGEFIPYCEESGLIGELGAWVLKTACHQAKEWLDMEAAIHQLAQSEADAKSGTAITPEVNREAKAIRVAVNFSPRQFQGDVVGVIRETLETTGLPPSLLEIEITETTLMQSTSDIVTKLNEIRAMGIMVSIDDFGTGYSSIGFLKQFRMDSLKMDRSFVADIIHCEDNAAIAKMIIELAHHLRMNVVAEGVETVEQLEFLRTNRCNEVQGYYFCKPVHAEELRRFVYSNLAPRE